MSVKLILGPAGSGKTHRCLGEIRDQLLAAPEGKRLLCIAPRQSTFLLERQLLSSGLDGFTRLEILSFERLAQHMLEQLKRPVGRLLSQEGRVMVLRALLLANQERLQGFKNSAHTSTFASQLAMVLRELHQAGANDRVVAAAEKLGAFAPAGLASKMADLGLILEQYQQWLKEHQLLDPDELLNRAAAELQNAVKAGQRPLPLGGLWMDGFAEMTRSEIELLTAVIQCSEAATLAFCRGPETDSSLIWSTTNLTIQRLRARLDVAKLQIETVVLPSGTGSAPRFKASSTLQALAQTWSAGGSVGAAKNPTGISLVECVDPEAEALLAAKLINQHVRDGGRYRDVSVMVRQMADYAPVLNRVFRRHGIPFFADHREPMGHHPLAELTRSALSLAAQGWAHADWMEALKTGLVVDNPPTIDWLENLTLKLGLRDQTWLDLEAYSARLKLTSGAELAKPITAFNQFKKKLGDKISGADLAQALRELWAGLGVPETLESWETQAVEMRLAPIYQAMQHTAWEQINSWCDNLALAFGEKTLSLQDWLAIAEAGLGGLTLGVIPPVLDHVFIGAIDRSRQPEVKLAIVLGLNAGAFPAAIPDPPLLNLVERKAIDAKLNLGLCWDQAALASREEFYAYIACTRASHQLCVSWSRRDLAGKGLVRSPLAERLLRFVGLDSKAEAKEQPVDWSFDGKLKRFDGNLDCRKVSTAAELHECHRWDQVLPDSVTDLRQTGLIARDCRQLRGQFEYLQATAVDSPPADGSTRRLKPESVAKLFPGTELASSVSALENFASCPFRHFAERGLRLCKRDEFEANSATTGTFLHAILNQFHKTTVNQDKQWRDLSSDAAQEEILKIGKALMADPKFAPQSQDGLVTWETGRKIQGLAATVRQLVEWFKTYKLNPRFSEFKFRDSPDADGVLPDIGPWFIELGDKKKLKLQGSIDRLDVAELEDGRVVVAVLDYKMGGKSPDKAKLQNGFELQLLGYLAFVQQSQGVAEKLGKKGKEILPGGAFYIPLSPKTVSVELTEDQATKCKKVIEELTHEGRGDATNLKTHFDESYKKVGRGSINSGQFKPGDFLASDDFKQILKQTEGFLKKHALAILSGEISVLPARFGADMKKRACNFCPYPAVCRFEPVYGEFRTVVYRALAKAEATTEETDIAQQAEKKKPAKKSAKHP